jgi:hypothetical protein
VFLKSVVSGVEVVGGEKIGYCNFLVSFLRCQMLDYALGDS